MRFCAYYISAAPRIPCRVYLGVGELLKQDFELNVALIYTKIKLYFVFLYLCSILYRHYFPAAVRRLAMKTNRVSRNAVVRTMGNATYSETASARPAGPEKCAPIGTLQINHYYYLMN